MGLRRVAQPPLTALTAADLDGAALIAQVVEKPKPAAPQPAAVDTTDEATQNSGNPGFIN